MVIIKNYAFVMQIYVPINDGFAHWYLAVLIVETQIVEIWDSLPSNSSNSHREEIVRAIVSEACISPVLLPINANVC